MKADRLKALHRLSGLVLAVFFFFHVVNHLCAWGGADMHIGVMKLFRIVYRFPPIEFLLLLSAIVQVVSGPILVWRKKFRKDVFNIVQALSGLYLSFFLFYHIRAVMLGRYVWNAETDFHFAAWGVKNSPADRFFIPYYSLSVMCVFLHLACVHRQKMIHRNMNAMHMDQSNRRATLQAMAIIATGVVVTTFIITGFISAH